MAARKNSSRNAAIAGTVAGLLAAAAAGYFVYGPGRTPAPAPLARQLEQQLTLLASASLPHGAAPGQGWDREQAVAALMALPELQAWSARIEKTSNGKAHGAVIEYDPELRNVEGRLYYQLSFIENSDEAALRWESFLVGQADGAILVEDDIDGEVRNLAQWRGAKHPMTRNAPGE